MKSANRSDETRYQRKLTGRFFIHKNEKILSRWKILSMEHESGAGAHVLEAAQHVHDSHPSIQPSLHPVSYLLIAVSKVNFQGHSLNSVGLVVRWSVILYQRMTLQFQSLLSGSRSTSVRVVVETNSCTKYPISD